MSSSTSKTARKAGVFQVIEGGLSNVDAPAPVVTGAQLPGAVEAERLRRAILLLKVPGTGLTVSQALDEIQALYHEQAVDKIERASALCSALEDLGLRCQTANPNLELARDFFLNLTWPDRLLAQHPELAGLHPKVHPYLQLG